MPENVLPGRRLGRRPPSNRPALRLADVLTGVVPAHPTSADHLSGVHDFGMYGNDRFGDCGPVSVANSLKVLSVGAGGVERSVSIEDVYDLYRRSGNPGFNPVTGADDNGVDMQTMLDALLAGGIGGYKPLAFAKVDASNLDEVRAAISIFGCVLFGVDLQEAQQDQLIWDYQRSAEWGGHAVAAGAYTGDTGRYADVRLVSWAQVIGATDAFLGHQLEECWVVIWPEHLAHPAFQAGVDLPALAAAYRALTGRALPVPAPTPAPAPTPGTVDAADLALAAVARPWVRERHTPVAHNDHMKAALTAWLTSKGL